MKILKKHIKDELILRDLDKTDKLRTYRLRPSFRRPAGVVQTRRLVIQSRYADRKPDKSNVREHLLERIGSVL